MIEIDGRSYRATVGSDVIRDGMYVEVQDETDAVIAEVFYNDVAETMRFTAYRESLPVPLIEWIIGIADERLIPAASKGVADNDRCE